MLAEPLHPSERMLSNRYEEAFACTANATFGSVTSKAGSSLVCTRHGNEVGHCKEGDEPAALEQRHKMLWFRDDKPEMQVPRNVYSDDVKCEIFLTVIVVFLQSLHSSPLRFTPDPIGSTSIGTSVWALRFVRGFPASCSTSFKMSFKPFRRSVVGRQPSANQNFSPWPMVTPDRVSEFQCLCSERDPCSQFAQEMKRSPCRFNPN